MKGGGGGGGGHCSSVEAGGRKENGRRRRKGKGKSEKSPAASAAAAAAAAAVDDFHARSKGQCTSVSLQCSFLSLLQSKTRYPNLSLIWHYCLCSMHSMVFSAFYGKF